MKRKSSVLPLALELSGDQHGVVSRRQLLALSCPARTIADAVSRSHLFPVFAGVYLVGRPQLTRQGLLVAALMAAGDGSVLGLRSAAAAWGFLGSARPVDVLRLRGGSNRQSCLRVDGERWIPRLVVHQPRHLPEADVALANGLAITTPARTLLDLAAVLPERQFVRAFMEADRLQLLDDEALADYAGLTQGRKGAGLFKTMVQRRNADIGETRSLLEAIVLDLVERESITAPQVNRKTNGYRPDFRWPEQCVLVEADGYEFHRGREAFESDVLRANRLRAEGWTVLRFTWRMVTERSEEVATMIRRTITQASGPGSD
jgi:very-short-patch-repair endonuclease